MPADNITLVKENGNNEPIKLIAILPDERAMRRFIDQYWEKLLAYCQHYMQDRDDAREVVQEICCTLWDRRAATVINSNLESYLFALTRNKVARYYRDKYRDERRRQLAATQYAEQTQNTEETVNHRDMQRRVAELVTRLPERCGEVYVLSRDQGLPIREIAGKLSISEKTVETHLTKALKFLRSRLRNERY